MSAAIQDSVGKVGDITFEARAGLLTLSFNRYRWEAGGRERVRSALQLGGVQGVQVRRIRRETPEAVLQFLAVTFEPVDAPGGAVIISCAGGGDIRAMVECLDVVLADLSEPWPTPREPAHKD